MQKRKHIIGLAFSNFLKDSSGIVGCMANLRQHQILTNSDVELHDFLRQDFHV